MTDAMATEWIKMRTVRTTWGVLAGLAGVVALTAALAWYVATTWDTVQAAHQQMWVTPLEYVTGTVAQLCLSVLGVLTVTAEYATGMIRTTLAAQPARSTVLAAKAVLVAGVAALAGGAALVATVLLYPLILDGRPVPGLAGTSLGDRWPQLAAATASVTMFALLGLALGALTRSAVAAIATLAVLWYPLPMIVFHLPEPWHDRIGALLPGALADQLAAPVGGAQTVYGTGLPAPVAALVMAGWALLPLAAATIMINKRDA